MTAKAAPGQLDDLLKRLPAGNACEAAPPVAAAIDVAGAQAHGLLAFLKGEGFHVLSDLAGVDLLHYEPEREPKPPLPHPERFAVVYHLLRPADGARLRVRAAVSELEPAIATAADLWKSANWLEREAYDLIGVSFTGHPDLRRILMPEGYVGHPLQKDYPVQGRGEREAFPRYQADVDFPSPESRAGR